MNPTAASVCELSGSGPAGPVTVTTATPSATATATPTPTVKPVKEITKEKGVVLSTSSKPQLQAGKEEPERHTINPLLSPTKSTRLTMGSRVIILGTDNVEQRVPQYVGLEAEIVLVPVHPSTWFKVKFDNGKIVTFRPSALRLVSDGTTVDANYSPPPKKPKAHCRPRSNSLKSEKSSLHINVPLDGSSKLLTATHPDTWPGCKVRILSGRMTGQIVKVLGSGNGWVQLESSYGELAKRANELELLSGPAGSSIAAKADTLGPLGSTTSSSSTASSNGVPMRPTALQRRRSNSEPGSPTEFSNRRNEFSTKNSMRKERKETELQRQYVQRYIDKQQAKIGTRPDLKYWLSRLQGAMVDPDFERNVCREVRSHFCHSCYMEMWSGSKYCWNELCSMSPVYWKLTGDASSPPLARYKNAAKCSTISAPLTVEAPVEDSASACEVLLSLRSEVRLPPSGNAKDPTSEKSSVTFAPSPLPTSQNEPRHKRKIEETKSKRSDSTVTDSEDINDDSSDTSKSSSSAKLRIKLSPARSPTKHVSPSSPRKQNSPRPSSTSPRFKRIKMGSSPFAVAQGAPPSAEEFAKIVNQHEQQQLQNQKHTMTATDASIQTDQSAGGPLPGLVSTQIPNQISHFTSLTTTSPLLTSLLNPDYPTNKATIMANVLEDGSRNV